MINFTEFRYEILTFYSRVIFIQRLHYVILYSTRIIYVGRYNTLWKYHWRKYIIFWVLCVYFSRQSFVYSLSKLSKYVGFEIQTS